jgi:hypothetical protein
MPIGVPLRFITAIAGLVVGYYAGFFIEDKKRAENSVRQFYYTLAHMYGSQVPTIDYDDEDEAAGLHFRTTSSLDNDEDDDDMNDMDFEDTPIATSDEDSEFSDD